MSITKSLAYCVASIALLTLGAAAAPLTIAYVSAPQINCVFNPTCKVVVNDSVGNFALPGDVGTAILQSRTYPGVAGAPAAGLMAYVYRVDLTNVKGLTAFNCARQVSFAFGPVVPLLYDPANKLAEVFVVTQGGVGSLPPVSADQTGATVTFTFTGNGVCPGQTSFFFGLASKSTMPVETKAVVSLSLGGNTSTIARVP